jgi:hypothetical protein
METVRRNCLLPEGSFFLFGPRGTGKTTLRDQRFGDALRIDLLAPAEYRSYFAGPERLIDVVSANAGKSLPPLR